MGLGMGTGQANKMVGDNNSAYQTMDAGVHAELADPARSGIRIPIF
jgi:hypothetical protein